MQPVIFPQCTHFESGKAVLTLGGNTSDSALLLCINGENHSIRVRALQKHWWFCAMNHTESQSCRGWKGPLVIVKSNSFAKADSLQQVTATKQLPASFFTNFVYRLVLKVTSPAESFTNGTLHIL